MKTILRNILAVILGALIGGSANMGLIIISGSVIAPPEGADVTTMEGLQASMHLFELKHYIFPFLAHALGTFIGAFFAALIANSYRRVFALVIGAFFLIGGIANVYMLPSPVWFTILDLLVAYIPMALLAYMIAKKIRK